MPTAFSIVSRGFCFVPQGRSTFCAADMHLIAWLLSLKPASGHIRIAYGFNFFNTGLLHNIIKMTKNIIEFLNKVIGEMEVTIAVNPSKSVNKMVTFSRLLGIVVPLF